MMGIELSIRCWVVRSYGVRIEKLCALTHIAGNAFMPKYDFTRLDREVSFFSYPPKRPGRREY